VGFDPRATEKAQSTVESFKQFIVDNKDELTALQIIYSKPYRKRHITYEQIKQLAEAIEKPPYHLTLDSVWQAYEKLEKSKVIGAGPHKLLTNIISLVRFAMDESQVLQPFPVTVDERFQTWLMDQERAGQSFTPEQMEWLEMIKQHISTSLSIEMDDLEMAPFYERGGPLRAYKLFGQRLNGIMEELNEALADDGIRKKRRITARLDLGRAKRFRRHSPWSITPSSTYNESGNGLPFYQGKLEFGQIYPVPRKWCTAPKKIAEKEMCLSP